VPNKVEKVNDYLLSLNIVANFRRREYTEMLGDFSVILMRSLR